MINYETVTTVWSSSLVDLGTALALVIGLVVVTLVALMGLRYGLSKLVEYITGGDMSFSVGGFYVRNLPYKGYHRFRSRKWNMEHAP